MSGGSCLEACFRVAAVTTANGTSSSSSGSRADVLALDVEYVHLAQPQRTRLARSRIAILPAEVCLAAPGGVIAFHSFCHPGLPSPRCCRGKA
jgi:hypothetical protein